MLELLRKYLTDSEDEIEDIEDGGIDFSVTVNGLVITFNDDGTYSLEESDTEEDEDVC